MTNSKNNNKDSSSENYSDAMDEVFSESIPSIDEEDEFAEDEFDEFGDDEDFDISEQTESLAESNASTDQTEGIGDDLSIPDTNNLSGDKQTADEVLDESNNSSPVISSEESVLDSQTGTEEAQSPGSVKSLEIAEAKASIDEIYTHLSQLMTDNEDLKQQIASLSVPATKEHNFAEEIDKLQKEQRSHRNSITSIIDNEGSSPLSTYVALGAAILSLLVSSGLGFINHGIQSDVAELSGLVSTLEEEIEPLETIPTPSKTSNIDNKIKSLTEQNIYLHKQMGEINSMLLSKKSIVNVLEQERGPTKQILEQLAAKVDALEKKQAVVSKKPVKKTKKVAKGIWTVNLVSFKQKWYAENKALEFKRKGFPVKVVPINIKGKSWYRLSVKGFKTKYEAATYAVKVKKALNLSSVWVAK